MDVAGEGLVGLVPPWGLADGCDGCWSVRGWVWFVNSGREHLVAIREFK